ncbi:MAG TPA: phosphotransferase family protein [Steroidobacteraceae bacterium]|nr:phosphotransferase family protein [Steroidobacteraceae bacterium]
MEADGLASLGALRSLAAKASQVRESSIEDFLSTQAELKGKPFSVRFANRSLAAGASGGTLMFDVEYVSDGQKSIEEFVLRFDLGDAGIFSQVSLVDQYEIMRALRRFGVAAPEARWIDRGGKIVAGSEALIMGRINAPTPCIQYLQAGPYAEASPELRRRMVAQLMSFVAGLHQIRAADFGVPSLWSRGGAGLYFIDREIVWAQNELHARFPGIETGERAALHTDIRQTLDRAAGVLRRIAPQGLEPAIIHGDPTFANAMFDRDGNLVAMLDWELCHHGLPAEDVTYFLSAARVIASLGGIKAEPPGRDEAIAAYEAAGGRPENWDFAAALSTFRLASWGAVGMRRMPREHWPAQKLMWELQKAELSAALGVLAATAD